LGNGEGICLGMKGFYLLLYHILRRTVSLSFLVEGKHEQLFHNEAGNSRISFHFT